MVLALLIGTRAWDDGAITLAYARTFATTVRIALTPLSEQEEGISTPAWLRRSGAEGLVARFFGRIELLRW